ncbi:unnamed protein product [Effrenium voratum]|nr:unnamed protein product [Effrenium voratum]
MFHVELPRKAMRSIVLTLTSFRSYHSPFPVSLAACWPSIVRLSACVAYSPKAATAAFVCHGQREWLCFAAAATATTFNRAWQTGWACGTRTHFACRVTARGVSLQELGKTPVDPLRATRILEGPSEIQTTLLLFSQQLFFPAQKPLKALAEAF